MPLIRIEGSGVGAADVIRGARLIHRTTSERGKRDNSDYLLHGKPLV
jgi:hypothetical protein